MLLLQSKTTRYDSSLFSIIDVISMKPRFEWMSFLVIEVAAFIIFIVRWMEMTSCDEYVQ